MAGYSDGKDDLQYMLDRLFGGQADGQAAYNAAAASLPKTPDDMSSAIAPQSQSPAPSNVLTPPAGPAPMNPIVAKYLASKVPGTATAAPASASSAPATGDDDSDFASAAIPTGALSDSPSAAASSGDALPSSQAAPITAPSSGGSLNPMVARYLAGLRDSRADMASAQAATNQNTFYANLARAGGTLAHALSKSAQPMDQSGFNALDKSANQPVENVQAQQNAAKQDLEAQATVQGMGMKDLQQRQAVLALKKALADSDPNSPRAKLYRQLLAKADPTLFKGVDTSGMTAEDMGELSKLAETNEAQKMRLQTAALAHEYKASDKQNSALQNTQGILESTRGSPAVAQAEKDIYAAQKANTLMNLYGDPNKLNPQMSKLVVAEIGKIASGGQSSEAELNAITPSTLHGALAGAWQRVSGDPTPANLGSFLKQYQDYSNQITKDAQSVIQDRYGRVIQARAAQLGPQNTKALQDQYLGRFTQEKPLVLGQSAPAPAHPSGARPGDTVRVAGKLYTVGADGNSLSPVQ